jgi:hypothetical protein
MTNAQITRAVAEATGENISTIRQMGFVLEGSPGPSGDGSEPLWLDCPFCGQAVLLSEVGLDGLPDAAECEACDTVFDYQFEEIYESPKKGLNHRRREEPALAS